MSFFGPLSLRGFDDDPFASTRSLFSQMDRMMGSMMRNPFGDDPFFGSSSFPALMAPPIADTGRRANNEFDISPFGTMMSSMFPSMPPLPPRENVMREGSCHSFSSSSVMTMTTGPDGRPQVYQASSTSRSAPGGVRETRKTVADSTSGLRKMAVGHHIGDRSHVIEKEMKRGGDLEERQELVNLEEEEAEDFDREFKRKTREAYGALEHRPRHRNVSPSRQRATYLPALPASSSYRRRQRPLLAISSGSSRSEDRGRHREKGVGKNRTQNH